jgi:hypothetical protein
MGEFIAELRGKGLLNEAAAHRIGEIETRRHVPLGQELNALLYLGALFVLAGTGAAVKDHFDQLGPMTIVAALALAAAACFAYCAKTAKPFETTRVASAATAFDYVLYLACGLTGILVGYIEHKWGLLGQFWDLYLFAAGLACVGLAYRYDNLLVLSTGLVNLMGWIGVRSSRWDLPPEGLRAEAFALGAALIGLGEVTRRTQVKEHFEGTYMRIGINLALLSLVYGATHVDAPDLWLLLVVCAMLGVWSARLRRFETFATALVYAYVAALISVVRELDGVASGLIVVVLSSAAVLTALLYARARFRDSL